MNVFEKYGLPDPSKPAESQSVFAKYGLPEPEAEPQGGFIPAAKQAIGAGIKGLGQAAADFIPGVSQGNGLSSYGQSVIDANPTKIHSLSDIADSPWQTVKEATGNALGSMGPMLGARAVGMGLSGIAPFTGPAAPIVGGIGQLIANAGPIVAAAAPSFGGIREQQIASDPNNEADAKSKAIALLGAVTVGLIESKFGPQEWALAAMKKGGIEALASKFAGKSIPAAVGKGIAHGAAVEGAEELVQNPIEQLAGYQDPTTKANVLDTMHGGAMGAIGGGVLGGGMEGTARAVSGPIGKAADTADKSGATFKAEFDRVMQEEQALAAEQTKTTKQGPKNEQAQEASTQGAEGVSRGEDGATQASGTVAGSYAPVNEEAQQAGAAQPAGVGLSQSQIVQHGAATQAVEPIAQPIQGAIQPDANQAQEAVTPTAGQQDGSVSVRDAGGPLQKGGVANNQPDEGGANGVQGHRGEGAAVPGATRERANSERMESDSAKTVAKTEKRMQVLIRRVQSGARIKDGKLLNKNGMVTANLTADEEAALQPYVKQKEPAKTVAQPYTPEQATKQFGTPAQPTTGGILPQQSTALDVPKVANASPITLQHAPDSFTTSPAAKMGNGETQKVRKNSAKTSQTSREREIAQGIPYGGWVLRNKKTGEVVMETRDPAKVAALNLSLIHI
jgi:hypothetical protein